MAFALPDGLAPEVYPLAWLVGDWRGEGVVGYPGIEEKTFVQDLSFDHDGGPYLRYTSTIRLIVIPDDPAELLDDPLLDALGFPRPSPRLRRLAESGIRARSQAVRFLPPRRRPRLRTLEKHRTYPHGYEIEELGPPDTALS